MQMAEANDYLKWLKTPGGNLVCLLITDQGEIGEHFFSCPEATNLHFAALILEQGFAMGYYNKDGGPQPWLRCEPCADDDAGNATIVLIPESDFSMDMPGWKAMAMAVRTVGRVDMTINW